MSSPRLPRLAVTLGDPRGIGPEITARALAQPLGAEIVVIGAEDQLGAVSAKRRIGVGVRYAQELAPDRQAAGHADGFGTDRRRRVAGR